MKKRRAKRTWIYVQPPGDYGIALHGCGDKAPVWSEWKGHLWCKRCKVDFIPEHNGIFDGPVPIGMANAMGMDFRRMSLKTKKIIKELSEPFIDCDGKRIRVMRKRQEHYR